MRRYAVKTAHGFRRFFETNALRAGMVKINVDYLMGHTLGISEHYFDADEFAILDDYLKAVNSLTINNNYQAAALLQQQVAELTEKSEQENYTILGKLAEKEKETEAIKQQLKELHEIVRYGMAHVLNDSMQGRAHTAVLGELASHFEKAIKGAEELSAANGGEEVKIVLQGETKSLELSPKEIQGIKSAIKEWRHHQLQQQQQEQQQK